MVSDRGKGSKGGMRPKLEIGHSDILQTLSDPKKVEFPTGRGDKRSIFKHVDGNDDYFLLAVGRGRNA